jgi:hypothetical protein
VRCLAFPSSHRYNPYLAKYKAASWGVIEVCFFQPIIEFPHYNLTGSLGSKLHRYIERDIPANGAHQYVCVSA